jgi:hypothetical protein
MLTARMLAVFEPMRRTLTGRELNADEIIAILKAWLHPSRREDYGQADKVQ